MSSFDDLPNIDSELFRAPSIESPGLTDESRHAPRILLLYGSLRARSFSRLVTEEAARLLRAMGAETRIFDPRGLPLPDAEDASHPKVAELRVLGRWMRMVTIPNQSSVPKAFMEFDDHDRMKPSPYYDRIVDVMEELVKFTWLLRDRSGYLTDRYSERKESAEQLSERVNQRAI